MTSYGCDKVVEEDRLKEHSVQNKVGHSTDRHGNSIPPEPAQHGRSRHFVTSVPSLPRHPWQQRRAQNLRRWGSVGSARVAQIPCDGT